MAFLLGTIAGALLVKSVPVIDRAATVARDWIAAKIASLRAPPGQGE